MQFGTTNAPADFQGYMKYAIREALDDFASVYLDDMLIYSDSEEEHVRHVNWIMQQSLEAGLYVKPEKSEFHQETVRYLGLIISTKDILMDEDKIETVRNWSREKKTKNRQFNNLFGVQQFVGFCNSDQWFMPKFCEKAEPLTRLNTKDEPFEWGSEQELALETQITVFTMAPTLHYFDQEREIIMETDASDVVSAGVLSQLHDQGVLHPVAYYSRKHWPAECNYDIYD
jgi:hypothetical protein